MRFIKFFFPLMWIYIISLFFLLYLFSNRTDTLIGSFRSESIYHMLNDTCTHNNFPCHLVGKLLVQSILVLLS
uniref:Uncharacterized protein n=1 Tax=Anguilla anguilla TaxID=7936 RepID=A0A0E9X5R1_ANGAN